MCRYEKKIISKIFLHKHFSHIFTMFPALLDQLISKWISYTLLKHFNLFVKISTDSYCSFTGKYKYYKIKNHRLCNVCVLGVSGDTRVVKSWDTLDFWKNIKNISVNIIEKCYISPLPDLSISHQFPNIWQPVYKDDMQLTVVSWHSRV